MKLLLILGSDETFSLISQNLNPPGFEVIRYRHVLKAMDNIEEIDPGAIIISARDFPRHWKTLVQFVRYNHPKPEYPIIILKGPAFSPEDASKAFYLGVGGIVSEDLTRPSEADHLQRLLNRHTALEDKDSGEAGICLINPVTKSLITGQVTAISATGLSFSPDGAISPDCLEENMELTECSIRIGGDFITPICRVVRPGDGLSLEFIFLPDMDRILLDNYLETLPPRTASSPNHL
jgi:hypothetical protein